MVDGATIGGLKWFAIVTSSGMTGGVLAADMELFDQFPISVLRESNE
jgi:hypothetical protein